MADLHQRGCFFLEKLCNFILRKLRTFVLDSFFIERPDADFPLGIILLDGGVDLP